jgi:hypothetical protein
MDLGLHPRGVTEGAGGEVIADIVPAPLPLWRRRSLVGFSAHLSGCARERFGVVPPTDSLLLPTRCVVVVVPHRRWMTSRSGCSPWQH